MRFSRIYLIGSMCLAEVLTMLGTFTFPALMPLFINEWNLSNTEAGWIAGIFLGGYAVSVPVILSSTDRFDARLVYICGATLTAMMLFGFAFFASGFWSALVFRLVAGVGLAATYMPGLRVLVDRYGTDNQARAIAFYTACFSLGTAMSFYFTGQIEGMLGWFETHIIAGCAAFLSVILVFFSTKPIQPQGHLDRTRFLDFRPVLQNRESMGFIFAYCMHSWELFAMRSWLVVFLTFCLKMHVSDGVFLTPTAVATIGAITAMFASICGNELAERYGRRQMVIIFSTCSGLFALCIGFFVILPY